MAKELFNSDFYTLPEQVQINKEDIETNTTNIATNTADITKLKDDISKIKPNAWEERKFNCNLGAEGNAVFTTYNPITDANAPVNAQKSFINKDTYSITDAINSYSFFISDSSSGQNTSIYAVCTHPSNSLLDILDLDDQNKPAPSIVLITSKDETGKTSSSLNINCTKIKTDTIQSKSIAINDNGIAKEINSISDNDDTSFNTLLTAFAINEYYLKKIEASNTYLSKTEASNTYVAKQDYDKRFDTGVIALTEEGFNKIKAMAEKVGTTITLTATTDFSENVQLTNTRDKELILGVNYDVDNIYKNIHVMPNQTIDDYDALQGTESTWYTGHAMLTLPSQDNGYFAISYQNGTHGQLILTLLAHY